MKKTIPLFWPAYNGKRLQFILSEIFPIDSSNRWLGQGPMCENFEKQFSKKFNYDYCLSVNSGSSALELAYHIVDIKPNDKVIVPVLTCTATNIPLLRRGAKIIFADIKKETLTIDPVHVKSILQKEKNIKAIVAVTLGGIPIDKSIFKMAKRRKIPVIIDAAQSLGVSEKYGDYIAYSFQAIKHFTSGDGGMLILRNKEKYLRAKKLRWFGIDRESKIAANWQPYEKREMTMDIEEAGYKFHMNDIAAAIATSGLIDSDKYLSHRKKIAEYYFSHLNCKCIAGGSYWLFGIIINNREKVAEELKNAGIETNMAHLRNDIFTVFGGKRLNLPNMNNIEPNYLYIPINTMITKTKARYITKTINNIIS